MSVLLSKHQKKRKKVEIFLVNRIKAAAERIYFLDNSIKWQLWHNIKVQKYRLETRQDCASDLSQSATDWTQNYGELGGKRESIMWEATTFWCKKSEEAKLSHVAGNDTRDLRIGWYVTNPCIWEVLLRFNWHVEPRSTCRPCLGRDVFRNNISAQTFEILSSFVSGYWSWWWSMGYHLRVPSKMVIIKNLDDQGSLCQKLWSWGWILVFKDP